MHWHSDTQQATAILRATNSSKCQRKKYGCLLSAGHRGNLQCYDLCRSICHSTNKKPIMQSSTSKLKFYDNSTLQVLSQQTLDCQYNGASHSLNFKIIRGTQKPLLSGTTCEKLGLITVNAVNIVAENEDHVTSQFSNVFQGFGCLAGNYHVDVDPLVKPVQYLLRRVPLVLKDRLKAKIDDLEQRKIIEKVQCPTPWISSMVTVVKPNKLQICIDPKDLNKAIKCPNYQMPILDEILPKLANAKVFSVLDAKDGFHQVKLDESSSYLTTFWTPFGHYRYLRMPFGISSTPEEYLRRMYNCAGLKLLQMTY